MRPIFSVQAIDIAVVITEPPLPDKFKAEAFVKAVGAGIAGQGIDEDACHEGVGETPSKCQLHHFRPVAFAQIRLFSNPDVNCAEIGRDISPIVTILPCWIDNLDEANGAPLDLSNELLSPLGGAFEFYLPTPIIVRV
jgi:hypothetical protein